MAVELKLNPGLKARVRYKSSLGFDFVAAVVAEAIVAGVFVEFVEGGEVKYLTDQIVEGFLLFDEHHAVVDDFCGDVANDVYA